MGRRGAARLADAHPAPEEHQGQEAVGHAAERGEARPDDDGQRDDVHPAAPLGEAGDGDAERRIEQGEGQPTQQAELGVGELQVDLDRLTDGRDDRAVDEVEGVGQDQQPDDCGLVAFRIARLLRRGRRRGA